MPGLHISPDIELARIHPLNHYILRSGGFQGKTLAVAHGLKADYLTWMKTKYYEDLPHRHIIRKAVDQWLREDSASSSAAATWSLPPISSAPKRFREADGFKHMYMSERFLKKTWKTTPDDLVTAGVQFKVTEQTKTKAKKFSLFQLYEHAKGAGGMSAREADDATNTEIARIMKSRANYASFKSGGYDDDGADFMYDFY